MTVDRKRRACQLFAIVALMLFAGCGKITLPIINGPRTPVPITKVTNANPVRNPRASRNWSGYEIFGHQGVTSITGSWQVPLVDGPADADSSTWIGIGGDRSPTLIQAGTDQSMQHGQAVYYAWVEMLPDPPTQLRELTILPGDTVTFTLTQTAAQTWALTATDKDANQTATRTLTYSSCLCSAEWIVEAPSINGKETVLANFTSVTFTKVSATIQGQKITLASGSARAIRMTDATGRSLAMPQVAQADGFSVVDVAPQQSKAAALLRQP